MRISFCLLFAAALHAEISAANPASFAPPNDLYLEDRANMIANIPEGDFNQIIDSVIEVYKPIVAGYGATLTVDRNWSDGTVNAYADQSADGKIWKVAMFGGLARRSEVTPDGFAMVVCHELGHHLAGFPVYQPGIWASAEGQSDYFATQACARKVWQDKAEENAQHRTSIDPTIQKKCDASWKTEAQQNLCYRVAEAGFSLGHLLSVLGRQSVPSVDTPDVSEVNRTAVHHPRAQCRFDTYLRGALCVKTHRPDFIPGKGHPEGNLSKAAEHESAANVCHQVDGFANEGRPLCWFKPAL